jgi:DNA-binding beta-propeller fold protein YncE
MPSRRALLAGSCAATALIAAGCGSRTTAQLPPPAGPPDSPPAAAPPAGTLQPARAGDTAAVPAILAGGRLVAVVDGRARTLTIRAARSGAVLGSAPAGVGPTHVACVGAARCYVTDTRGDGLLVFVVGEGGRTLRLTRRVFLPGGPYGIAVDAARRRLWVTAPGGNHLALLPAHGRPHVLAWFATLRRPEAVRVDPADGAAIVTLPSSAVEQRVLP